MQCKESKIQNSKPNEIKNATNSEKKSNKNNTNSDSDTECESNSESEFGNANVGWADSIAKILKSNKPKGKKTLVLSRAKKINDKHKVAPIPAGFQVATTDGIVKEEMIETESKDEEITKVKKKRKKEIPSVRIKPNVLEKDRERRLNKIATKGVVQLFNAVRTQQREINEKLMEAGPLEVKKDKVLKSVDKRSFLNVLMGEKPSRKEGNLSRREENLSEKEKELSCGQNKGGKGLETTWNVLRDDFMMGAKMKDWDKELENEMEEENEVEEEMEIE